MTPVSVMSACVMFLFACSGGDDPPNPPDLSRSSVIASFCGHVSELQGVSGEPDLEDLVEDLSSDAEAFERLGEDDTARRLRALVVDVGERAEREGQEALEAVDPRLLNLCLSAES